jgi:colanic acid biosynthesis glycosyl transferase WcaI
LALRLERWLLHGFDRIVTISERMRALVIAKGVPPERLVLVRNWVDLAQVRPLGRPSTYRAELGLPPDRFVVLYAGSIGAKQALSVVLNAAASLRDEPRVTFVIAGDGPDKDRLVADYGALPNLLFLPIQPEERLGELLNLADLHVLPQQRGIADLVLPSKLGGMLASGKPILVTADPGTELYEFLDGTATLVPAGDSEAVAGAIRQSLAANPDRSAANLRLAALLSNETCLAAIERALTESAARDPAPARAAGV